MIKVLIVDDSAVVQELFTEMFGREGDFEVVGCAGNRDEALQKVRELRPDVVTMDVNLPGCDGFSVTRMIMEECPVPIVIVSAFYSSQDAELGFRLLDTGALAFHDKPAYGSPDFHDSMKEIIMSVRLMSEVRVVRRKSRFRHSSRESGKVAPARTAFSGNTRKVVCIGASTGGPQAVKQVLMDIPVGFSAPVIIVQHMSCGFTQGMVNWLRENTGHDIMIAKAGDVFKPGVVYFAPEGYHLEISATRTAVLSEDPPMNGIRPSVSSLFASAARNLGRACVGVLLTGMGRDGAAELLEIRKMGGHTIAQDEETSIVFGMPGEAVKIGGAVSVLPLDRIGPEITKIVYSGAGE
ncbi:chemotaxis-specific protein-glutamate methyltransferase CheB [Maridesulfovibrio sp.]|uniref:chemotaxis-specific protein-glutamate methyltransferase CheB n=1 Tax=Maridesulfovibrio sp. TaxID=2795000 RepID=UPI002A18B6E9|nr:chemotaxis-specific protein-glutamate methyltransferase CheB [Maridesulfovibrio sp.]